MNQIIKQIQNRRAIRNFTNEKVKDEDLELILRTAQRSPSSENGQQTSIVYTRDKEKLKKLANLCGKQEQIVNADIFVLFIADFYRTNYAIESIGKKQIVHKTAGSSILGALDSGIYLFSMQVIAESLGYGTTAIGEVRTNPEEIIKLFNLPKYTFPIVGSTIGVPTKEALKTPFKPQIPFESFAFEDSYDEQKIKNGVNNYEKELNKKFKTSYKKTLAKIYCGGYMPKVKKTFLLQKFDFQEWKVSK